MRRLQAAWDRVPSTLRFGLATLWALMTAVAIPTLRDGVAGWAEWLAFVGAAPANYVIPALGLLALITFALLEFTSIREQRRGKLSPGALALAPSALTPAERLNKALSEALSLRDRAASHPNEKPPIQQDPLYRWAQRTYELICEHHPAYADDFYGPDATVDPGDLFMAFAYETQDHGRNRYLEQRIALLKAIMAEA